MKKLAYLLSSFALVTTSALAAFPDSHDPVPANWTGPVFRLSQNYPAQLPVETNQPWLAIDFFQQPEAYVQAVFNYFIEGNNEVDWNVQRNSVRTWYHAPWMHYGATGREFVRGLTRERTTPAPRTAGQGELGPQQKSCFQNWAVSVFNGHGGYQIGRIWKDQTYPDVFEAVFPEGTVAAKLLFSAATVDEVPYLKNTLEWDAATHDFPASDTACRTQAARSPKKMRLLQIDLAVKDKRAPVTGWVFATYAYDGNRPGATWPQRMAPVGIQWGSDPGLIDGQKPKEGWINPNIATPQHLGLQGRLNGPVDNPKSACMSCHTTAQVPARSPMLPPPNAAPDVVARWFRNLPGAMAFDERAISTDYSLQIAIGIQNFQLWKAQQGGAFAPEETGVRGVPIRLLRETAPVGDAANDAAVVRGKIYRIER